MTTGTKIIQGALQKIGVHSPLMPAPPEAIDKGKDILNSMISEWEDDGIKLGASPLKVAGSELSEPLGAKNAIELKLAEALGPEFPGSQVSSDLVRQASIAFERVKRVWKVVTIPKKKVRGTLPKGSGNNQRSTWDETFFDKGSEIG